MDNIAILNKSAAQKAEALIWKVIDPIHSDYIDREPTNDPLLDPLGEMKEALEATFPGDVVVTVEGNQFIAKLVAPNTCELSVIISFVAFGWEDDQGVRGVELEEFGSTKIAANVHSFGPTMRFLRRLGADVPDQTVTFAHEVDDERLKRSVRKRRAPTPAGWSDGPPAPMLDLRENREN